jgi:hypothetical protein
MKKFTSFTPLTEDTFSDSDISNFKSATQYMKSEKDKQRYIEAIDALYAAFKSKSIYKARFGEYYSYGLRPLEGAYETLYYKMFYHYRDVEKRIFSDDGKVKDPDFYSKISPDSMFSMTSINKLYKHWEKNKDLAPEVFAFMKSLEKLPDFIKTVKGYVIAGREPKPVDPNTFVKPMVPLEAKKRAIEFLDSSVNAIRNQYYESMTKVFMKDHDFLKQSVASKLSWSEFYKQFKGHPNLIFLAQKILESSKQYDSDSVLKLNHKSEQITREMAHRAVDDIIAQFLAKNSEKLGLIFQKKSLVSKHEILQNRVNGGNLENTMRFEFPDGSGFTIYSTTVFGYSQQGKEFVKLPTRFTDVKMADGSKMTMPSEEKMIKDF